MKAAAEDGEDRPFLTVTRPGCENSARVVPVTNYSTSRVTDIRIGWFTIRCYVRFSAPKKRHAAAAFFVIVLGTCKRRRQNNKQQHCISGGASSIARSSRRVSLVPLCF